MARTELEWDSIDFITIGTVGPKGKRTFYLQAGRGGRLATFLIEKEQAWALSEAIGEFIDDLDERYDEETSVDLVDMDMELREPIQPLFRISQMGLAYNEEDRMIILIAQEYAPQEEDELDDIDAGVVRMWCTREQMRALSLQALDAVNSGRPDPKQNGRIIYYWT